MPKEKIGVGIVTCNRPDYLNGLLNSLLPCKNTIDELVVVNDGKLIPNLSPFKGELINNETNLGVAKSKNKALKYLAKKNCDYFFLIEDDMLIKDSTVFLQYVEAYKASGIHHFNYGPGSPFNRKQKIQNFDLHNRHLLDEKSEPNPKLIVGYSNNINIALYEHTVAMFSFFTKEVLQKVGGLPEEYDRCWEHVDHTYQIIKAGFHPPFWWFADLANSHELLEEAPGAINNSSIAKDKNEWMSRVMEGREIYKNKHGHYPNQPPLSTQDQVLKFLKNVKKMKSILISHNELESQNLQEFEELLKEYIKLKPSNIIEIGSLYGWTLEHFIHYAQPHSTILSIDLPVRNFVGPNDHRVQKQEHNYKHVWPQWAKQNKCKLYLINDASQNLKVVEQTKQIFSNKQVDFVFIDGNHMYNAVKTDFELYSPLVRKGGIVALHDIGENEEGGVHVLWKELKKQYKHKELLYDNKKEKGIGIIYI